MENQKHNESLELSTQELEEIAGGIAESQPAYPTEPSYPSVPSSDLYNEVAKKVNDSLQGYYGGGYTYYKKEEYEMRSSDAPNGAP